MALKKKRKPTSISDLDNKRPFKRKGFYTLLLTALLGMFLFVTYYAVQQVQVYQSSAKGSTGSGNRLKCPNVNCGTKYNNSATSCNSSGGCCWWDKNNYAYSYGTCKNTTFTSCSQVGTGLCKGAGCKLCDGNNKCIEKTATCPQVSSSICDGLQTKNDCAKWPSQCKWNGSDCSGSKVCKNGKCTASTTSSDSTGTTSSGGGGSKCSSAGGVCKSSCSSGETKLTGDYCTANPGKVCCKPSGGDTSDSCTKINLQKVCEKTGGCKWSNNKCVKGSGGGGDSTSCSSLNKTKCNNTKGCEWNTNKNKCVDKSGGGGDSSNPCKDAGGACRLKANGCGVDETQSSEACAGSNTANKICCKPNTGTGDANPCKDAGNACRTKVNGCGEGELETDLACAGPNPDNKICCGVVDETPTGETGTATFDMSLSFQGIISTPLSGETTMDVLVTLAGGELVEPVSQTTTFTVNDSGIWTGEVSFDNITSGGGYKLLVKGPKHMQKKVCDAVPTETAPGTYRCGDGDIDVAVDSVNTADFSGIRLLVGDLAPQDGIVDAYDVSLVRNNFCTTENPDICKDPKLLSEADLNLDGIIDSQDYSLVISSLSIKYDEL